MLLICLATSRDDVKKRSFDLMGGNSSVIVLVTNLVEEEIKLFYFFA